MATESGISGTAVAVATLGAVLVYAGFRGVSPLQALRDVTSGSPPPVESRSVDLSGWSGDTATYAPTPDGFTSHTAARSAVVAAAQRYTGDKYSQLKRTRAGYSDCSSFVDKALMAAGIDPPVKWASTASYRATSKWRTIPLAQAQPGDIAINGHHMVLVTGQGGSSAIGQQNSKTNVRTGTVKSLMSNDFYIRTWKGWDRSGGGTTPAQDAHNHPIGS